MTHLRIISEGVEYLDLGVLHRPALGEIVTIRSSSVVNTLLASKLAEQSITTHAERPPVEAKAVTVSPDRGSESQGEGEESVLPSAMTWEGIPGISAPSLKLLAENAPGVNPLDISDAAVVEALCGSNRRAARVIAAIAKHRVALHGEGGDD